MLAEDARKASLTHTEGDIRDQRRCMPRDRESTWISALGTKLLAFRRWSIAMRKLPGECNRLVSEHLLHDFRVLAGGKQNRGTAVPQIVDSDAR